MLILLWHTWQLAFTNQGNRYNAYLNIQSLIFRYFILFFVILFYFPCYFILFDFILFYFPRVMPRGPRVMPRGTRGITRGPVI